MSNVIKIQDAAIEEIQNTQKMCQMLMKTPHYQKIGAEGIFAIVEKAKSIGVSPLEALNGGMYYVKGKVELSAALMNQLIRSAGHSITKDKRSNDQVCILHGKRADNSDTWVEGFSLDEAKQAGIYTSTWLKYPRDMLFARALSRLARQLFPDVIKGCYVQGEISAAIDSPASIDSQASPNEAVNHSISPLIDNEVSQSDDAPKCITNEQYEELEEWIGDNSDLRSNLLRYMQKKWNLSQLSQMPQLMYEKALSSAKRRRMEAEEQYGEQLQAMGG